MAVKPHQLLIESVVGLNDAEIQSIVEKTGLNPQAVAVTTEINPALLAGLRIRLDGYLFDYSAKSRLEQLHERLTSHD